MPLGKTEVSTLGVWIGRNGGNLSSLTEGTGDASFAVGRGVAAGRVCPEISAAVRSAIPTLRAAILWGERFCAAAGLLPGGTRWKAGPQPVRAAPLSFTGRRFSALIDDLPSLLPRRRSFQLRAARYMLRFASLSRSTAARPVAHHP